MIRGVRDGGSTMRVIPRNVELVEVEDIGASTRVKVLVPSGGIKYAYFKDVCRIKPEESRLDNGYSGSAIVAEDEK